MKYLAIVIVLLALCGAPVRAQETDLAYNTKQCDEAMRYKEYEREVTYCTKEAGEYQYAADTHDTGTLRVSDLILEAGLMTVVGFAYSAIDKPEEAATSFATARRIYYQARSETTDPKQLDGIARGLKLLPP